jgi:hypothetical protein
MMDNLSAKTVKRIFIFFLIYLPLQYAVVGIVGYYSSEPWPAFVFPGFKSVYVYGNTFQINHFMVEVESRDGQHLREFTPQQYFYEIPNSQVAGFIRSNLQSAGNVDAFDTETQRWFRDRAEELLDVSVGDIYYLHRRQFLTRLGTDLRTDSVKVLNRIKIAEAVN